MTDALQGISQDVPFDFGAASALETAADGAASSIEAQLASRTGWVSTAMTDFKGHFSQVFNTNAGTARSDAQELITALRDTATGARKLAADAKAEQARRVKAREWKTHHDHRGWLETGWDDLTGGDDCPIPPPSPTLHYAPAQPSPRPRQTPAPGSGGGGGGGTSSARPEDLHTFATNSATANETLRTKASTARSAYANFTATCHWGSLSAEGVFTGFATWLSENDNDVRWATVVANAFTKAGSQGGISTLADSAIDAALKAANVDETRQDLSIQMPSALGHPPTTGYANDPVNTATGNFVETEIDLEFPDATGELSWRRSYNSVSAREGAFGAGWSSWVETGLVFDDQGAHFTMPDGRTLTFPRLGDGWDRAVGASLWLNRAAEDTDGELLITDNVGGRWRLAESGRLLSVDHGPGTRIDLEWADGRLVALTHERGRTITLVWDEDADRGHDRVIAALSSEGQQISYSYDLQGRLVAATGPGGTRSYRWHDAGGGPSLIEAVIDADGVIEVENSYDEFGRVTRQRSPHGRTTRFVYLPGRITVVSDENGERSNTWIADNAGRLVGVVDADEHRSSFAYDAHGNPVLATERDGSTTITEYDARGRKIRQVLPSGADLVFAYDALDRITRVDVAGSEPGVDPEPTNVSTTLYEYERDERNPSVIVDPEGGRTELTWTRGLLTRVVDPTGVIVSFEHDEHGELIATVDAEGNAARLERDPAGRVTAAITPSGVRTVFGYHPDSGLLATRTDPDGAVWSYDYTAGGRLVATVDPTGARTVIERDAATGDEVRTVDPLGRVVASSYDDLGNLATLALPDGSTWSFVHDALSRLREITDPAGATVTADYDLNGATTRVSDASGITTEFVSDPSSRRLTSSDGVASVGAEVDRLGRLIGEVRPDGSTVLTRYDRCGRPIEIVGPTGALTRIERDAAGRVTTLIRPSGAEVNYTYDACGRLASVTDPTGGTTRYCYDADGRLLEQTDPVGEVETLRYDACGRLVSRRTPGVGTSTFDYDACSRVIESHDPVNGRRRFTYDGAGQVVETLDGNGGVTTFGYDPLGRCVLITHPDGGTTRREFDAHGHCTRETDPLGRTTTAGYDAAGRQLWQADPDGRHHEWRYDAAGRLEARLLGGIEVVRIERDIPGRRVVITDRAKPTGEVTIHELTWDERGLLTSRTRDGRGLSWTYDPDGTCTSLTTPDGRTTTYARDAAGRLAGVGHPLLGNVILERDAAGRLTRATAEDQVQTWVYAHGDLVAHTHDGPAGRTHSRLTHDEGRITAVETETEDDGRRTTTTYSYDQACQLIAAVTGSETVRWSYDACGRLVRETTSTDGQRTSRRFEYDLAGQLQQITVGEQAIATFSYDAAGRRSGEQHVDGTRRDYDWSPAGWLAALTQTDRLGDTVRTEIAVDALGELAYVDGIEAFVDAAMPHGGIAALGDRSVVRAGAFTGIAEGDRSAGWAAPGWRELRATSPDPWAVPPAPASPAPGGAHLNPFGDLLLGLASDPLEWLANRVYDARTRAFLSTDPLAPTPGAGWAANPYSYAGNDPLHALDPLGLHPVTDKELQAYNANNGGLLSDAGHWLKNNWEYVAGGAMVIAGGVLIATGVGGPAGMMLVSAGASTIIQKATTGHVNWGEVALSGALGGIGGGAASLAARATEGGVVALRTTVMVNAGVGAASTDGVYAYRVATGSEHFSAQGLIGNTITGGVAGGIGGAAGPAGGTIAKSLGQTSTGLLAKTATAGVNFAGGFGGDVAGSAATGQHIDLVHSAESGAFTAGTGALTDAGMDRLGVGSHGVTTLKQLPHFGVRTGSGVMNLGARNTRAMWGSAAIGGGLGFLGP